MPIAANIGANLIFYKNTSNIIKFLQHIYIINIMFKWKIMGENIQIRL